jgi:von Willebrand factor type A domain
MKNLSIVLLILAFNIFFFSSCEKSNLGAEEKYGLASGPSLGAGGTSSGGGSGGSNTPPTSGVLTAGEWNDLENWAFWKNLILNDTFNAYQTRWGFKHNEKWEFIVKDANAQLLPNAIIQIKTGTTILCTGRTNKYGSLHILPFAFNNTAAATADYTIEYNGTQIATGTLNTSNRLINVSVPSTLATVPNNVDVMFVVDATGSMGDEITYLKNELLDVLNRADNQIQGAMRFSSVFYRDFGDAYVTKASAFTTTKSTIVDFVKAQAADGGGDYPEAVEEALKTAMQQSWSVNAKAKILFLIADAPAHETEQILSTLKSQIKEAASRGIMIIPVAASGVDKSTEFLFRFMAQSTNSTYTFLTNNSGIGNNHITATVGTYQVEFLNNLMVRLISKYGGN